MTQTSQDVEFNVLGCKVRIQSEQNDSHIAKAVIGLVDSEVQKLKSARPGLRDTDIAVLVALKMGTEKMQLEEEYKNTVLKLEESLQAALTALSAEAN